MRKTLEKTLERIVSIPLDSVSLEGVLALPAGAASVVVFAHGSGSSRHSPRNKHVAGALQEAGMGTLLFDLLTVGEDALYINRFDIGLLSERLKKATEWLRRQPMTRGLRIGYFGASTGTAAAIKAAADIGEAVKAIVSRGGRPDLAAEALPRIRIPTLLIVGGMDSIVMELNERAFELMEGEKKIVTVEGASHLFEEPGALEEVARLATEWFKRHL